MASDEGENQRAKSRKEGRGYIRAEMSPLRRKSVP